MSNHTHNAGESQPDAADNIGAANDNSSPGPERDAMGRFAAGNKGGPGNPFGRRLASMRQAILRAVSEDDIEQVMRTLVQLAHEGDVAAAKLVLQYTVGKPQTAVEPDRVDVDEWNVQQDSSVSGDALNAAMAGLRAPMASFIAAGLAKEKGPMLAEMIRDEEADRAEMAREDAADLEAVRRGDWDEEPEAARPSAATGNGQTGPLSFGDQAATRPSSAERNGRRPSNSNGNGRSSGRDRR